MNYDANLFCEIIETEEGIRFIRQEDADGFIFRFYQGSKGFVIIDYDDDAFTDNTGKAYLKQLGLEHIIKAMYPQQNETAISNIMPIVSKKSDIENDCDICYGEGKVSKIDSGEVIDCVECDGTGAKWLKHKNT